MGVHQASVTSSAMPDRDFEWLEVLGRGMSGVCRKVQNREGQIMVVKQIDLSFVTREEEAKLLSSLSHPNVIRFHDEFVDDELLHIVMEFAPYGTLKQNLAKMTGLIPESSAAWILLNIMNGIDFLHQRKIVHRDLKSENIFIGQDHVPKVGDFGVATRLNSAQPMAVSVVGTPLYLSPELCNGAPYDTKSDIWAAGVLMYEVCSMGRLPFAAGNQGAVINKILTGHFAPLSPQYSAEMHRMLGECLRQSPSERPTAHVLHQRLRALRHSDVTKESATAEPAASQAAPAVAGQGADHFSLVPHEAEPQRTNSEPMWWEWASKNGFVTGQFRTLYGGTPHHSPSGAAVDRTPGAKHGHSRRRGGGEMPRGGDRSHVDGGSTGSILPFSRERYRPTSAPSTPSSAGSPAAPGRRKGNGQDDLLGYLVSTPAILDGPLQAEAWVNRIPVAAGKAHMDLSAEAKRADLPLDSAVQHPSLAVKCGMDLRQAAVNRAAQSLPRFPETSELPPSPASRDDGLGFTPRAGQRGIAATSPRFASPVSRDERASLDEMPDTPLRNAGTIPPLAFTAVDDLTGWLQGHVSVLQQSSGESSWKSSRMLRPTSSPESQHRSRHPELVPRPLGKGQHITMLNSGNYPQNLNASLNASLGQPASHRAVGGVDCRVLPPSRVYGLRLGGGPGKNGGGNDAGSGAVQGRAGRFFGDGPGVSSGLASGVQQPAQHGVHASSGHNVVNTHYASRAKKGQLRLAVKGVQPRGGGGVQAVAVGGDATAAVERDSLAGVEGWGQKRFRDAQKDSNREFTRACSLEKEAAGDMGAASGGGVGMLRLQLQGFGLNGLGIGHQQDDRGRDGGARVKNGDVAVVKNSMAINFREREREGMGLKLMGGFKGSNLRQQDLRHDLLRGNALQ